MQGSNQSSQQVSYMMRNNRIDLWVSGLNFPNHCSVYFYQRTAFTRHNWIMFGATEEISDVEDPVFKHRLQIIYFFSARQEIYAEIMDPSTNSIAGKAYFVLADLFTAPNQTLSVVIQQEAPAYSKQTSFLTLRAEHFTDCLDEVKLKFAGTFDKKNVFTTRTCISLWKQDLQLKKYIQVGRSEFCSGNAPFWNPLQLNLINLCGKDYTTPLKLNVHKGDKDETLKGTVYFTLEEIFTQNTFKFDLLEVSAGSKGSPPVKKKAGTIVIENNEVIPIPQFIDYVFGGLEIHTSIGIDFSTKGGSETNTNSPHYFKGDLESRCEVIVKHFSEVLGPYNPSKEVSCFGFGATIQDLLSDETYDTYSSCFLLTNEIMSNSYSNIKQFKESYRRMAKTVEPHQIRFITPVVETIVSNLRKDPAFGAKAKYYNIILLIEDEIEDVQELIDYMVHVNEKMAVTLIVIGMGKGPYANMDGFNVFVGTKMPFYDTKGNVLDINAIMFLSLQETKGIPTELVKELLKFIPDRVLLSMMKTHTPPHKLRVSSGKITPEMAKIKESVKDSNLFDPGFIPLTWE